VNADGAAIELEIWKLPIEKYGMFVAGVPSPLGFGTLELMDGSQVQGFLCEAYATVDAVDISHCGGWKSYITHQ
jgi:allophanate hydrolase